MTYTNQKLREALQAISHIDDSTNHAVDASAALDRIGKIARQALALPTADHLPDAGNMVVDHFPDATKMIETAAPVGEHELPPLPVTSYQLYYQWPDDEDGCGGSEVVDGDAYTADQMRAYARAALSDGDAVDAQRTPLTVLQYNAIPELCAIPPSLYESVVRAIERAHGIDAAMRKG